MDIATTLLEYGAKTNSESKAGFTPLHLSSQEGHTDMTALLLQHQADPNARAKVGNTSIVFCNNADLESVENQIIFPPLEWADSSTSLCTRRSSASGSDLGQEWLRYRF